MKEISTGATPYAIAMLPFTLKVVSTEAEMAKALSIRQSAYARHLPDVAKTLGKPEALDFQRDTNILLVKARLDEAPLGTMRIHRNDNQPLPLEQSFKLPSQLSSAKLAEATRFGLVGGDGALAVKSALFKAFFLYSLLHDVDYMVITARHPLDRMYERLMFKDVEPAAGYVPMKHVGNLPHRVLYFSVKRAEKLWFDAGHPLFDYVFRTVHPDIEILSPLVTPVASETEVI